MGDSCNALADYVAYEINTCKTVNQLRETLSIPNDFTSQEEAQIHEESEWVMTGAVVLATARQQQQQLWVIRDGDGILTLAKPRDGLTKAPDCRDIKADSMEIKTNEHAWQAAAITVTATAKGN